MPVFDELRSSQTHDELRKQEAEQLAQVLSDRYGIPHIDLTAQLIEPTAIKTLPEEVSRQAKVVVFAVEGKQASVAVLTPNNPKISSIMEELEREGFTPQLFIASEYGIEKALDVYNEVSYAKAETAGVMSISDMVMGKYVSMIHSSADIKHLVEDTITKADSHALSTVVEILLGGAIAIGVSDVHIEPEKNIVRVRYRMDGVLQNIVEIEHSAYKKILSRIKLLAGTKLNIVHQAQDGRFTIKVEGIDVEVRTSILPSAYAEAIVMRILNPKSISVPMEELGMDEHLYAIMEQEIRKPNGLILTTGPTGSGKTTTLYAILKKICDPGIKIITIEDPIEYHLEGISQTQVEHSKGYDFHNGLRAAVRQDPDVIMVGEIRDNETATIAIDSALTGHLVFSTLHTNSAAGAIPRLIDLGVNPKIISSSLNIALAQRLVRKLCQYCKQEYSPEGKELEVLNRLIPEIQPYRPEVVVPQKLWKANGCERCTTTGYKGRISIYEGILMDREIENLIREGNPSERELREAARPQGILDMRGDGIMKIIAGITTMDEVERTVGFGDLR